jgi:MoaA/NifB/PqqE/SkfB family radical SAM enzyme
MNNTKTTDTALNALTDKLKHIPKYPRLNPPYRVHFNWEISFKCNYKCSYCEVTKKETEFNYKSVDLGVWKDVWDRMFENYWCCHVRFSGGEPSFYPGFIDLISMLIRYHTVDITTNLSFDIDEFMAKVPPNMGVSVSSSYHPEFSDMKSFLAKVKKLHYNGYPSTICYVGYPSHLDKISEYKKMVEGERIYFKIIPFAGEYKGKKYPESYTSEERALLEGFTRDSKDEHLNDMNKQWYKWRVEKSDEPVKKIKKGSLCQMGQMYAKIHPDGTVTRCCAGHHGQDSGGMGSIFDKNFKLLEAPEACLVGYQCPCFKGMFVGEEEDKWVPLWEALEHAVYKTEYAKEYAKYLKAR